jgi:hypothetical protein
MIAMATVDAYGNYTYPTVEGYWRRKSVGNGITYYASGVREGSRISFTFSDIEPVFGQYPYDAEMQVVPSGTCTVSGQFKYLSQADSCVFSAGVGLQDYTVNDDLKEEFLEYVYISDVLLRSPWLNIPRTGATGVSIAVAPSKMIQRIGRNIVRDNMRFQRLNTNPPYNYNKFLWSANSDLHILNPNETIEVSAPDDGNTFTLSSLVFSAAQGQEINSSDSNPDVNKTFGVVQAVQFYDSIATNPMYNTGVFITTGMGTLTQLNQHDNLSGILAPEGATISEMIA